MRALLALALVVGIAALAWVTFSGTGSKGSDPGSPSETPETDSPEPADAPGESGSGTFDPPVAPEPREEIPPYPWTEPAWKTAMANDLAGVKIRLDVRKGKLDEVLQQLGGQLPWQIDASALPEAAWEHEFRLSFVEADPMLVLRAVAQRVEAVAHLRPSGLRFLPEGMDPAWERSEIHLAGLRRARLILDAGGPTAVPVTKLLPVGFEKVALRKVLPDLGNRLRTTIEIDPRVTREQRMTLVTLRSSRMTAAEVLDDVTAAARLTWAAEERQILVTFEGRARAIREERARAKENAAKEVELAVKDRPLHRVAELLEKQLGVPIVIDRALWEPEHPSITLRAGPESLRRLLPKLAKLIPARFLVRGEAIYLIPPAGR